MVAKVWKGAKGLLSEAHEVIQSTQDGSVLGLLIDPAAQKWNTEIATYGGLVQLPITLRL